MGDSGMEYDMANGGGGENGGLGPNRAFPPKNAKLGSKIGSTREGGRGASDDVVDQGQVKREQPGYAFYGASDGRNDDTFHQPEVKQPTKPSLNPPY